MISEKEFRKIVRERFPALKSLVVLDEKGREIFSYRRKTNLDKDTLNFFKARILSKGFRQALVFYDDKIIVHIKMKKGYIRAVYPVDINLARNLLRLRELERIIWG